jgi:hypothetical protein
MEVVEKVSHTDNINAKVITAWMMAGHADGFKACGVHVILDYRVSRIGGRKV